MWAYRWTLCVRVIWMLPTMAVMMPMSDDQLLGSSTPGPWSVPLSDARDAAEMKGGSASAGGERYMAPRLAGETEGCDADRDPFNVPTCRCSRSSNPCDDSGSSSEGESSRPSSDGLLVVRSSQSASASHNPPRRSPTVMLQSEGQTRIESARKSALRV